MFVDYVGSDWFCEWQTIVPSALQLLAMAAQMLSISPLLSLISALVIKLVTLFSSRKVTVLLVECGLILFCGLEYG